MDILCGQKERGKLMTIYISESCGSYFAGYIGEHLATTLIFPIPDRIADCDYYRVAFGVNDTVIRTEELTPAEGESSAVRVLLWQELTLSKTLTATLEGYVGDRYIGKSSQATLRFERAVGGDETEADTDPHGMQMEVAENTKARHTHENKVTIDKFDEEEDVLLWNGLPIEGGGTVDIPFYNDASDLPETGTLALVRTESPLYDPYIFEIGQEFDRLYINPEPITPWEESSLYWDGGALVATTGTELPLPQVLLFIGENQWAYICCPFNGQIVNMVDDEPWKVDSPRGWIEVEFDPINKKITGIPIDFSEIPELTDIEITSTSGDIGYFISPYPYPQHNQSATLYAYDELTQEWRSVEGFENLYKLVIGNTNARHAHPNPDILNSFYAINGQVYLGGVALGIKIEEVDSVDDLDDLPETSRQAIVRSFYSGGTAMTEGQTYATLYKNPSPTEPIGGSSALIGGYSIAGLPFSHLTKMYPVGWQIVAPNGDWYWYLTREFSFLTNPDIPIVSPLPIGWYKQTGGAGNPVVPIDFASLPNISGLVSILNNPIGLSALISPTPYTPTTYYTLYNKSESGWVEVSDPKMKEIMSGLSEASALANDVNKRTQGLEVKDGTIFIDGNPVDFEIPLVYDESDLPESGSLAVVGKAFGEEVFFTTNYDKVYLSPIPDEKDFKSGEHLYKDAGKQYKDLFYADSWARPVAYRVTGDFPIVSGDTATFIYEPGEHLLFRGWAKNDVLPYSPPDAFLEIQMNNKSFSTWGYTNNQGLTAEQMFNKFKSWFSPTPFTTKYTLYYYDQTALEWVKLGSDIPPEILAQIETNKTDIFDLQGELITLTAKQTLTANGALTINLSNGSHCFISVEGDCTITLTSTKLTPFCLYISNPDEYEITITDAEYMQGVAPRILSENYQVIGDFETVPKIAGVIECVVCEEEE